MQQLGDANDQLSRQLADLNAKATQLQTHIEKLTGILQQTEEDRETNRDKACLSSHCGHEYIKLYVYILVR